MRHLFLVACLALASVPALFLPAASASEDGRLTKWRIGTGARMGDDRMTADEAFRLAELEARRDAVQKAVGYLVADHYVDRTLQKNNKKTEFTLRTLSSSSHGLVVGTRNLRKVKEPITDKRGAVLQFKYVVSAEYLVAEPPEQDASFEIKIGLPRSAFVAGDTLTFEVTSTKAANVWVFNHAENDKIYMIYPNAFSGILRLEADAKVTLPDEKAPFELKPAPLPGDKSNEESIKVIAVRKNVPPPKADKNGVMSVEEFYRWICHLPAGSWAEDERRYTVVAGD